MAAFMGSAQEFKGEWDSIIKINGVSLAPLSIDFYSYLDTQYVVSGFTLEAATIITEAGLANLWFEAYGTLGAFSMWSLVGFDPMTPKFVNFENAVEVSIAGVNIYGLFGILPVADDPLTIGVDESGIGSGFALGGIGTAGDIRVGVEFTSNLYPNLWFVMLYGLNGAVSDWTYTMCASDIWNPSWIVGALAAIQTECISMFSYLTVVVEFPICCADVYVMGEFSCEGFDFMSFLVKNLDIGIPWLNIYELGITYTVDAKAIDFTFKVVTGDVVCFKPYWTIVTEDGGITLDGIKLNALTLSCDVGGCEIFWGHIFDFDQVRYTGWMWPTNPSLTGPYVDDYRFEAVGGGLTRFVGYGCAFSVLVTKDVWTDADDDLIFEDTEVVHGTAKSVAYPNEVFGFQCDQDSCCGGLFSFSVNNFFSTNPAVLGVTTASAHLTQTLLSDAAIGIFGWMGSYVELTAGIGSNLSVIGGLKVTAMNKVEFITMGFELAW
jgi:hypothetical protein